MPWVFVYGTLMREMVNHHLIQNYILQCLRATSSGELYHLPEGCPMLVPDTGNVVHGQAMKIYDNSSALGILDELEDFFGPGHPENLYERVERVVHLPDLAWKVRALTYVCPEHKIKQISERGILVSGGNWKEYIATVKKKSKGCPTP